MRLRPRHILIERSWNSSFLARTDYFPEWGFLKIAVNPGGLPAEYFSPQKRIIVPAEQITVFLEEYGEVLRREPSVFVDEGLFTCQTLEKYEKATVEHKDLSDEGVSLDLNYDFGGFRMSFQEIFQARKDKKRFLIHGDKWVDTFSREFAWMDGIDDRVSVEDDTVTMSRTEYLRFLRSTIGWKSASLPLG